MSASRLRGRLSSLRLYKPSPWQLVIAGALLGSAIAWAARPGGGGSYSGGSSSSGDSSGSGGGDSDFIIQCLAFLVELCLDRPRIGIPLLVGFLLLVLLTKVIKSGGGRTLLVALGGAVVVALFMWSPEVAIAAVGAIGVLALVLVIIGSLKKKPADWHTARLDAPAANAIAPVSSRTSPRRALERLRDVDPEFSLIVLEDFLYSLYAEIAHARGAGRLERYAPYLAPSVRAQLAAPELGAVKDVVIGSLHIRQVELDGARARISVEVEANFTEVDRAGVARGYYQRDALWLSRRADARSRPPDKARVLGCPSCGANLDGVRGSVCSYCNATVDGGETDWLVERVARIDRDERGPNLTTQAPERGTDDKTVVDDDLPARLAALEQKDSTFQRAAFTERVERIFAALQRAWSTRKWQEARPFVSDNLYQAQQYWIDAYLKAGLRNVNDETRVDRIQLVRVTSDRHFDAITVRLFASGLDFTVADDGKLVCGSRSGRRSYSEYWTLIRGASAKASSSAAGVAAVAAGKCPSCGAELRIAMAGVCEFCGAKVTMGEFDWVLSLIEQDESYGG